MPKTAKTQKYNKKTLEALKEAERITSGKIDAKGYTDVSELFKDLLKEY